MTDDIRADLTSIKTEIGWIRWTLGVLAAAELAVLLRVFLK